MSWLGMCVGGWSSPGPGRLEEKGVLGKKASIQPVSGEALLLYPLLLFSAHRGLSTGPLQIVLEAEGRAAWKRSCL